MWDRYEADLERRGMHEAAVSAHLERALARGAEEEVSEAFLTAAASKPSNFVDHSGSSARRVPPARRRYSEALPPNITPSLTVDEFIQRAEKRLPLVAATNEGGVWCGEVATGIHELGGTAMEAVSWWQQALRWSYPLDAATDSAGAHWHGHEAVLAQAWLDVALETENTSRRVDLLVASARWTSDRVERVRFLRHHAENDDHEGRLLRLLSKRHRMNPIC